MGKETLIFAGDKAIVAAVAIYLIENCYDGGQLDDTTRISEDQKNGEGAYYASVTSTKGASFEMTVILEQPRIINGGTMIEVRFGRGDYMRLLYTSKKELVLQES